MPEVRHGARAADGGRRRRARSRACGHDASVLDRTRADTAAAGPRHGRHAAWPAAPSIDPGPALRGAPTRARDTGGPMGRLAILRAGLGVDRQSQPQHVHAHRAWHRDGVHLQRRRHTRARAVPAVVPDARERGRALLRGRSRDHGPRAAGPGARVARAQPDEQRDPGAAPPRAADGAPARARRHRRGRAARVRAGG